MGCSCGGPQFTPEDLDHELPSEADMARFGYDADVATQCAECSEEIYDDCEVCPHCGAFQIRSSESIGGKATSTRWSRMSRVAFPTVVVLVLVAFLMLILT